VKVVFTPVLAVGAAVLQQSVPGNGPACTGERR
jgi:hypothetical protein